MASSGNGSEFILTSNTSSPQLSSQDISFLQQAQVSNLTEIAEGRLALFQAPDLPSQEFGRWMETDHASLGDALSALASQDGISLPGTIDEEHQTELQNLASQSGTDFSQAFAINEVNDHQSAITLFQQEINSGQDPSVVSFAQQALPLLQAHLQQSEILAAANTGSSDTASTNADMVSGTSTNSADTASNSDPSSTTGSPPDSTGSTTATTPSIAAGVSAQDQQFIQQAATSGLAEVTEGQLAANQSGNPAGSEFGRWMVADHTAMNSVLSSLAAQDGVQVPTTPPPDQQSEIASLQSLSDGSAPLTDGSFFQTYVRAEVNDHAQTLMQFITEANSGQDPKLVAFAKDSIPVLAQHLVGAINLQLDQLGIAPLSAASPTINDLVGSLVGGSLATSPSTNSGAAFAPTADNSSGSMGGSSAQLEASSGMVITPTTSHS